MTAQVYSYRRFSSPLQKQGGSIQRQSDYAIEIAKEFGLELNEDLIMTDDGLSAFSSEHVNKGALGEFIKAVDEGKVERGSVLIVESLDRLSREVPMQAQIQFNELISKGITIITANDRQVYNIESIAKDPSKLFLSIAVMIRAHEESLTKQKRSVAFIKQQVKKYLTEGKGDVAGSVPFWIDKTAKGYELNENADIAKLIVDLYMSNNGLNTISRELEKRGINSPKGKARWGVTTIRKVLDNPALFGRKKFDLKYLKDGREQIDNFTLDEYYPPLIDKDVYLVIQDKKRKKSGSREAYGKSVYLLSGYGEGKAICSKCGYNVGSQLQKQKNRKGEFTKNVMRLHCNKHKESLNCCSSFRAQRLESAFVSAIVSLVDRDLLLHPTKNKTKDRQNLEAKLDAVETGMKNLVDRLALNLGDTAIKMLDSKLMELDKERNALQVELDNLNHNPVSLEGFSKLRELAEKVKDFSNFKARKDFKHVLLQVVKRIIIDFGKESLSVEFTNGNKLYLNYIVDKDTYQSTVYYERKNFKSS
ncbi:recombinase family protein [Vibrio parahaemolyticus]|uniref:recombinase family protein n=1 Tax=Vibrio parahaemolyticus TaxID=670 RepID=UPI0018A132D9|nr:recombinase family protein [Vibrio parahaemolyticus]HCM0971653.1 recombinase family protein [Vibrio parahaemolyticus]